jgi:hypothetical protein
MAPPQSLSAAISHVLVIFALILPEAYAGGTVSLTKAPAFFYRATLCAGLHQLWRILASQLSRWKQWSTRDPEFPRVQQSRLLLLPHRLRELHLVVSHLLIQHAVQYPRCRLIYRRIPLQWILRVQRCHAKQLSDFEQCEQNPRYSYAAGVAWSTPS